jgi:hypothetical protein
MTVEKMKEKLEEKGLFLRINEGSGDKYTVETETAQIDSFNTLKDIDEFLEDYESDSDDYRESEDKELVESNIDTEVSEVQEPMSVDEFLESEDSDAKMEEE